ncbi:hypothetical protein [Teichococcus oryzae]|nr:hypothetical protein [Pseudoroseomonas oryzae]
MASPRFVFINGTAATGLELWVADSEFGERRLLKDINPGFRGSDPSQLTRLPDGKILFVSNDGIHGRELWITDGTEGGTRMLRDIGRGDGTRGPENLTLLPNGLVVFTADDGRTGRELWVTDGTSVGTRLLQDILTGSAASNIADLIVLPNGRLLFMANDGVHGTEMWSTDGTAGGTHRLTDAIPGVGSSSMQFSRIDGEGNAYFQGSDGNDGIPSADWRLAFGEWRTDGTVEGTVKVSDSAPVTMWGTPVGTAGNRWVVKEFYTGPNSDRDFIQALYVTDGTREGTQIILDHTGSPGAPSDLYALGNGLVVFPQDRDLYVTDGTASGTRIIAEGSLTGYWAQNFLVLPDGRALFVNGDNFTVSDKPGEFGHYTTSDLWITDGTEAGTRLISAMSTDNPRTLPSTASMLDDHTVVLTSRETPSSAYMTWKIDLGTGLVERLRDVQAWNGDAQAVAVGEGGQTVPEVPGTPGPDVPSEPEQPGPVPPKPVAGYVFVNAEGTHGKEIWGADSQFGERRLLKDINSGLKGSDPTELTTMSNGKVVFVANDGIHGRELWITDGTESGTRMLRDIGTGDGTYGPTNLVATPDGRVFFTASDGITGYELWVTDGTHGGTRLVTNQAQGPDSAHPSAVVALNGGKYIFSSGTGLTGRELWVTDGTEEGTTLIQQVPRTELLNMGEITLSADGTKAIVSTDFGAFVTDGTAEGTTWPGGRFGQQDYHAVEGSRWVFADFDRTMANTYEKSLFVTDGTVEGTLKLLDPTEQTIGGKHSGETKLTELGNGLVIFQGGADLYVTDGTKGGTQVIADDVLTFSTLTDFVSLGDGRALFLNQEGDPSIPTRADLWVTDGTSAGTIRIAGSQTWNAGHLPDYVNVLADGSVVFSAASMDGNPNAVWKVNMYAGGLQRLEGLQNWSGEYRPTEAAGFGGQDIWV